MGMLGKRAMMGAASLLAVGGGLYLLKSPALRKLVKLFSRATAHKLRPVLRPIVPGARALIFAFDGVGAEALYNAIRDGHCPHIKNLLGGDRGAGVFEHGYAISDAMSILPSTTMAAWSSIFTGQPPAFTGVTGNEWFVREEMRLYAPAPVSVTDIADTARMLADGLVGNAIRVPTLYELLDRRAHVALAPVQRGADLFTITDASILADLFSAVAKGTLGNTTIKQEVYQEMDENSVEALLEAIDKYGVPNLQVAYFPGIDLYSHIAEAPLDIQQIYLQNTLDPTIGRVLEVYQRAGVLDQTYVLFVADHGHTPVINDDHHSLYTTGDHEPPALLDQLGFRVRPFVLEPDPSENNYNAALAYQGAMAYIYLADRTAILPNGIYDWRRAPRFEEDVMAVVRAFDRVNRTGEPISQLKGVLDLIFARVPRPVGEDALPFEIFDGKQLVAIGDYLKRHPRPDLIRLESRMRGLSAGPYGHRAGDVLLLCRSGLELPIEERYYFSGLYRSWHGSPTRQDSHVPIIVARQNSSGPELARQTQGIVGAEPSQLDIVPLVLHLLRTPEKRE
ncbi:MAG: alkaline phosphatase family protein [Candidatus Binatia bacterium]